MKLLVFLVVVLVQCHARIMSKCEVANELRWQGFPEHQIRDWVCLVDSESSGDTGVIGGPNTDGSYDWGLFQINDRYWCRTDHDGGECGVNCWNLLSDDITLSSNCAKRIFDIHGFYAWYGWIAKCQDWLPDISEC